MQNQIINRPWLESLLVWLLIAVLSFAVAAVVAEAAHRRLGDRPSQEQLPVCGCRGCHFLPTANHLFFDHRWDCRPLLVKPAVIVPDGNRPAQPAMGHDVGYPRLGNLAHRSYGHPWLGRVAGARLLCGRVRSLSVGNLRPAVLPNSGMALGIRHHWLWRMFAALASRSASGLHRFLFVGPDAHIARTDQAGDVRPNHRRGRRQTFLPRHADQALPNSPSNLGRSPVYGCHSA